MENCVYTKRYLKDEGPRLRQTYTFLSTFYAFTSRILLFSFKAKNVPQVFIK